MDNIHSQIVNLKDGEEIVVKHEYISGLRLTIRKYFEVHYVLGVPVKMYTDNYEIEDNTSTVFKVHDIALTENNIVPYVQELLNCKTKRQFVYTRSLKEKGVSIGDVIEIEKGDKTFKAVICDTDSDYPNLKFRVLTKKGVPSKGKLRWLYKNDKYRKVGIYADGKVALD